MSVMEPNKFPAKESQMFKLKLRPTERLSEINFRLTSSHADRVAPSTARNDAVRPPGYPDVHTGVLDCSEHRVWWDRPIVRADMFLKPQQWHLDPPKLLLD